MKALSMDLRERIIAAVQSGDASMVRIAERFEVSYEVVKKLKRQWRELGTLEPQTHTCGRKRRLSEAQRDRLLRMVDENPSLTLEQMRDKLRVKCHKTTIWKELRRNGITHKKTVLGKRAGKA